MLRPAFTRLALLGGLQRARAAPPGAAQALHQTRRAFAHRLVGTAVALSLLGNRACAGSAVPRPHHHQAARSMSYTACDDYIVVYVTALEADAKKLATGLLEAQLAACVNIVPSVTSVYRWKGEVCTDTEALLVIKARKVRTPAAAHLAYLGASASFFGCAEARCAGWLPAGTPGRADCVGKEDPHIRRARGDSPAYCWWLSRLPGVAPRLNRESALRKALQLGKQQDSLAVLLQAARTSAVSAPVRRQLYVRVLLSITLSDMACLSVPRLSYCEVNMAFPFAVFL